MISCSVARFLIIWSCVGLVHARPSFDINNHLFASEDAMRVSPEPKFRFGQKLIDSQIAGKVDNDL
jgi:hypothetical protein